MIVDAKFFCFDINVQIKNSNKCLVDLLSRLNLLLAGAEELQVLPFVPSSVGLY